MIPPSELLERIGAALYGSHWRTPLGLELGISPETIRRWHTGRMHLGYGHAVWTDLVALLWRRDAEIRAVARDLAQILREEADGIREDPDDCSD